MPEVIYANPPEKCETCGGDFNGDLYDAKTAGGPWACMCRACFYLGPGLGLLGAGLGQSYKLKKGKGYVKIGG